MQIGSNALGFMEVSDGQIIADVLAGSRERFELIVARYQSALYRAAASRLGSPEAAEETVQETFCDAFKSLHTYNSTYSFRTWLWTILLNRCRKAYQKQQKRPLVSGEVRSLDEALSPELGPHTQAVLRERDARLQEYLQQLPEVQADAIRLRFFGGLKFHEIAAAMQCGLSTAKIRVRKGLSMLSQWIDRDSEPIVNEPRTNSSTHTP